MSIGALLGGMLHGYAGKLDEQKELARKEKEEQRKFTMALMTDFARESMGQWSPEEAEKFFDAYGKAAGLKEKEMGPLKQVGQQFRGMLKQQMSPLPVPQTQAGTAGRTEMSPMPRMVEQQLQHNFRNLDELRSKQKLIEGIQQEKQITEARAQMDEQIAQRNRERMTDVLKKHGVKDVKDITPEVMAEIGATPAEIVSFLGKEVQQQAKEREFDLKRENLDTLNRLREAQQEHQQALAELAQFRMDPNNPQSRIAQERLNISKELMELAKQRLDLQREKESKKIETQGELTTTGQKAMAELEPIMEQMQELVATIEGMGLEKNNTSMYLTGPRAKYALGMASPEGELGSKIANLELAKITGGLPYSTRSRNFSYIKQIQEHLPKPWIDSPRLIYEKLKTSLANMERIKSNIAQYEVKGSRVQSSEKSPAKDRKIINGVPYELREGPKGRGWYKVKGNGAKP